ncbi:MAG: [FeFe] hydrogenase H-cluster maturation GTPase HydF [Phocaeicola sp.]
MNQTPQSNRLHIALLGRRNSGKSSLINALTGQDTALVSDIPGTTTDPVLKAMEVYPLGACLWIDTPGFDDDQEELGPLRISRTLKSLEKTDIALLLCEEGDGSIEKEWLEHLKAKQIPTILLLNKCDVRTNISDLQHRLKEVCGEAPIEVSAHAKQGMEEIYQAILEKIPADYGQQSLTGNLVEKGDLVLLVMPQDIQAPKGRLILPQVQTLRELLDKQCMVMSCTTLQLQATLQALAHAPKLIITDSQVFNEVYQQKPEESLLTSFSVLFAGYKGDIKSYLAGATALETLTENSKVLIAEACTHAPLTEDIGRVKLPRLLRKRVGEKLQIDIVAGNDFPDSLEAYDVVIQCGACMFNRRYVMNRIERAKHQQVPITNYGIALAYLSGILDKIVHA